MKGCVRCIKNCPKGNEEPLRDSKQALENQLFVSEDSSGQRWRLDWRDKPGGRKSGQEAITVIQMTQTRETVKGMETGILFKRYLVVESVGLGD